MGLDVNVVTNINACWCVIEYRVLSVSVLSTLVFSTSYAVLTTNRSHSHLVRNLPEHRQQVRYQPVLPCDR